MTTSTTVTATARWLLAPATGDAPRGHSAAAAALRILVGLMWLYNVAWKRPPDFGQETGSGLYKFMSYAVSDPVFPPYSWAIEHLALPNIEIFGWGVLLVETALAVLLLAGAWVRLAALLGIAQSAAIALSVAFAPHEWPWSYWLMIGAHLLLLFSSPGRTLAADAIRAGLAGSRELMARGWGVLTVLIGLYSLFGSFDDPLAAHGAGLRSTDLSISLGVYNLVGALVLIVAGALILVPTRPAALLAAAIAVAGAVSLHAQIGFSDPWLGGTATSAAYLFTIALVAVIAGARQREPASTTDEHPRQAA